MFIVNHFHKMISNRKGFWGPIIGAAIGGLANVFGQKSANEKNEELSEDTRAWEERMANTAHQREIADLKAAGLNPMLSSHGGASTPTPPTARVENVFNDAGGTINSAMTVAINKATAREQIATLKSQQAVNSAQAVSIAEDARRKVLENDILSQASPRKEAEERIRKERPDWLKALGVNIKDTLDTLNPLKGLFKVDFTK